MIGASSVQVVMLSYLLSNSSAWMLCRPIIEPDFFDKELRAAVAFIMAYSDEYASLPSPEIVQAETGTVLKTMLDAEEPGKHQWLLDKVEKFCRLEKVKAAIFDAAEKLRDGREDEIVDPIRNAVLTSVRAQLGIRYAKDSAIDRLRRLLERSAIPTGFRDLDDALGGGPDRGTLNLFCAGCIAEDVPVVVVRRRRVESGPGFLVKDQCLSTSRIAAITFAL